MSWVHYTTSTYTHTVPCAIQLLSAALVGLISEASRSQEQTLGLRSVP
jgi:hypothetical protein